MGLFSFQQLVTANNMNKAVFLDRDGVLIQDVNYLSHLSQIEVFDDVPSGLKKLKSLDFKLIVVTNQSGVARGYFTEDFVLETHKKINQLLEAYQVQIDDFVYCPHHPDGLSPYNLKCKCRKPQTGMIDKAKVEHDIKIEGSFMVGDKLSDIEFAVNAKLTGILIKTGYGYEASQLVTDRFPGVHQFDSFQNVTDFIVQTVQ